MADSKSGLDILSEILDKLNTIDQKIEILDQNIKKVANAVKVGELLDKIKDTPLAAYSGISQGAPKIKEELDQIREKYNNIVNNNNEQTQAPTIKAFNPEEMLKKQKKKKEDSIENIDKKIFVKGKVIVKVGDTVFPVGLASVTIYDDKDKVVKETRTNTGGEYSSMLPYGKYVAEIKGKYKDQDLVPQNIAFVVKEGDKEVIIS